MKKLPNLFLVCTAVLVCIGIASIVVQLNTMSYSFSPHTLISMNHDGSGLNTESCTAELENRLAIGRSSWGDILSVELNVHPSETLEYVPGLNHLIPASGSAWITLHYAHGLTESLRSDIHGVVWGSDNEDVLFIWPTGEIIAVGVGTATIFAEYDDIRVEREITVIQGQVERIEFWPNEITIINLGQKEGSNVSYVPMVDVSAYTASGRFVELTGSNMLNFHSENPAIFNMHRVEHQYETDYDGHNNYQFVEPFATNSPVSLGRMTGEVSYQIC